MSETKKIEKESQQAEVVKVEVVEKKFDFWGFVWGAIGPALKNYWNKDKDKLVKQLKTIGEDCVVAIINYIKNGKNEK